MPFSKFNSFSPTIPYQKSLLKFKFIVYMGGLFLAYKKKTRIYIYIYYYIIKYYILSSISVNLNKYGYI